MEFTAKANFVRVSPQKARLVLDLIKGQRVEDALNTLLFTKKGIAPAIYKLVHSAMDNANYLSNEKETLAELFADAVSEHLGRGPKSRFYGSFKDVMPKTYAWVQSAAAANGYLGSKKS